MPTVRVPEGELYYRRVGTGPPLVFVNEWPLSHRYWGPLTDRLERSCCVIGFDPRGIGRSQPFSLAAAYDVEAHAEDLHELITALGLGEVHLVAHGLGAIPAALCLHRHPQDVRTLTIFNPVVLPGRPQALGKYLTSVQLLLLLKNLAAVPLLRNLLFRRYALGRLPKTYQKILAEDLLHVNVRTAWALVHSATEEIVLRQFLTAMVESARPVLIVACARDAWASVQTARGLFEHISAGMLVTMASPAHFPMLEVPEAVHQVLIEFYRRSGTW